MTTSYEITIKGLVQGVGFRPFIYKLAHDLNLRGTVKNNTAGVFIELQSTPFQKDVFLERVRKEKPDVSSITAIEVREAAMSTSFDHFTITASLANLNEITRVSPDIAICDQCLEDYHNQPHRINYPFVNCTHCGPRFSIVEAIPYDRPSTTMKEFDMCPICTVEYKDPEDRRFHAQPVACNHCGPVYTAYQSGCVISDYSTIVERMSEILKGGGVVALKGIGGFNWLVDASNSSAVSKLRELKRRYTKPFAVMCKDEIWLRQYVEISDAELEQLNLWRRAIVLLNEKKKLSATINGDLHTLGVMYPYMAIHFELFEKSGLKAIIVTSANKSGEPMLRDNDAARSYLLEYSDLYVEHNRSVFNRVDDSVIRLIDNQPQVMRRARGYAPEPIVNRESVDGGLAFGAEMTAVFALGIRDQIIMSQYIGDLSDYEVYLAYKETLQRLAGLFNFTPRFLVCDAHPLYLSSKLAMQMAQEQNLPLYLVQHHHAHAVSVMVEFDIVDDCIALSMDGVGYGDDGESWGCEVLACNRLDYRRLTHLPYVSLPGGDKAAKECWRMTVSYLYSLFGSLELLPSLLVEAVGEKKITQLECLLASPLKTHLTSSAGRLFDAVAALLGICYHNSYQAEAAMKLEQIAIGATEDQVIYPSKTEGDWDIATLFQGIIDDINRHEDVSVISMRFHRSLACQLTAIIVKYANEVGVTRILLTGGTFQNRLLSELLIMKLKEKSLAVYYPTTIPCNDGGIAVGQLAIASARINKKVNLCTNYQ